VPVPEKYNQILPFHLSFDSERLSILRGLMQCCEVHHGMHITDQRLHDKVIDLIDEAAAHPRAEIDSRWTKIPVSPLLESEMPQDPNRPIGSFIFLSPTGVSKVELACALAQFLFVDEKVIVQIDLSE
jgi:ATP-dependent Clp protease ATP-binding subunit ClpA